MDKVDEIFQTIQMRLFFPMKNLYFVSNLNEGYS